MVPIKLRKPTPCTGTEEMENHIPSDKDIQHKEEIH